MKIRRFLAFALTLVILMSVCISASAAQDDGSITIQNSVSGETYSVYKVFDLTYKDENAAYSYKSTGDNDAFLDALKQDLSPFELKEIQNGVYTVTSSASVEEISAWLSNNASLLKVTQSKKAESNELIFNNLEYGYYYITSSLGSVVTIDSTMKDVIVIDKNQKPGWDNEIPDPDDPENPKTPGKVIVLDDGTTVTENTANIGDTVNFSIAINATAYDGKELVTYYYISDTLGAGFSEAKDIIVKVNDQVISNYSVKKDGKSFRIDVPFGEKYGSKAKIEVLYSAEVLNTAVIAGDGNVNTANFTYATDSSFDPDNPPYNPENPDDPNYPDDPFDPENPEDPENPDPLFPKSNEKTTSTYVYALGILKVDEEGNVLSGAQFEIEDSSGNKVFAVGSNGEYVFCDSHDEDAVSQFAVNDNGLLVVKGVAAGEYKLTEKVAPEGYNILSEPISAKAELKAKYTTIITTYFDENGKVTNTVTENTEETDTGVNVVGVVVVNKNGTELPSTGGSGTTWFYIIGSIFVFAAIALLISKKVVSKKQ